MRHSLLLLSRILLLLMCVAAPAWARNPNYTPAESPAANGDAATVAGYADYERLVKRLRALPLHAVEGVWQFPADGGVVAIERVDTLRPEVRRYRLVVVYSANRAVLPGTVMGTLSATAKRGVYSAKLFTELTDGPRAKLCKPKDYLMELSDEDCRLTFKSIKKGLALSPLRLLPWMFRFVSVRKVDETPTDLGGLIRLFPAPSLPAEPLYL